MLITSSYKSFVFARTSHLSPFTSHLSPLTSHLSPVLNVNKCCSSFQVLKIYVVEDPKLNIEINWCIIYIALSLPGVDDDVVLHIAHVQTTIDNLEVELSIY